MKKRTQIALVLPLDVDFMRRVVIGVLQYAASKRWTVSDFREEGELLPSLSQWRPDGIIGAVQRPEMLAGLRALNVPYVDVSGDTTDDSIPHVLGDDAAIGALAAQHLMERGFGKFAYAGSGKNMGSDAREAAFRKQVAVTAGEEIPVYRDPGSATQSRGRSEPSRALFSWVASLSKPTGIMAANDLIGRQIVDVCNAIDTRVPEDVAVVACGNDEIVCRMSLPNLSSISLPAERIGHEAASLLDRMIGGSAAPTEPIVLPISSVVARQSSDVLSIPDPDVSAAVRFIRAHAGEWIGVREVLLAVSINRRSLERKFRQYLGRSPLAEIRRVRLEIAKDLLSRTDLSMPIVARRAGFSEAKQLSLMFHNELNTTPTAYRRKFRLPIERQHAEPADEVGN